MVIGETRHLGVAKRAWTIRAQQKGRITKRPQSKKGAEQKRRRAKWAQSKMGKEQNGQRAKCAQSKKGAEQKGRKITMLHHRYIQGRNFFRLSCSLSIFFFL